MKQTLHLLLVDREHGTALAATYGPRWLLPMTAFGERARALPLVVRWLTDRGVAGDVAGQWLGRVTHDAIDWLLPICVEQSSGSTVESLEWRSLDALHSSRSVLEYQQWALSRTLVKGALPFVDGPFGNLTWPRDVGRWIGGVMESEIAGLTPYRAGAHEVVLGAEFAGGRVYFKGLAQDRATEARITRALAAVDPASFAPTIALARRPDGSAWWLTGECRGRPSGNAHRVAQALARMQQRIVATGVTCELPALDLEAAIDWAGRLLGAPLQITRARVPDSWIPLDLDPTNVFTDADGTVRFIDVDDSFSGPAPLAIAVFAARCGDRSLLRTYEQSWSPPLADLDWPGLEVTATVVQAWLGWRRLERNIARGEVFADRELVTARARGRLLRAIASRTPSQARWDGRAT